MKRVSYSGGCGGKNVLVSLFCGSAVNGEQDDHALKNGFEGLTGWPLPGHSSPVNMEYISHMRRKYCFRLCASLRIYQPKEIRLHFITNLPQSHNAYGPKLMKAAFLLSAEIHKSTYKSIFLNRD
jgi:hypothetical protein